MDCSRSTRLCGIFAPSAWIFIPFLLFVFASCIESYAQKTDLLQTNKTSVSPTLSFIADLDSSVHDVILVVTSPFHFGCKEWTFAALCLGVEGTAFAFDPSVRSFVSAQKTPTRDRVIMPWEYYGSGYTAVAIGCGTYLYGLGFAIPWLQETGRELLTALTIEGAFGEILKIGFGRYRPYTNKGAATFNPFSINEASASLPSGHTTTAFTVSSVLAKRIDNPYVSCGLYAMAFFTGCQRIYSDNHWFSDVIMGAILGTAIGRSKIGRAHV